MDYLGGVTTLPFGRSEQHVVGCLADGGPLELLPKSQSQGLVGPQQRLRGPGSIKKLLPAGSQLPSADVVADVFARVDLRS